MESKLRKNKHLSQSIHKSCNNRHANLYYTNKNINHDRFARDGKKLSKRKKRQTRHKLLVQSANTNPKTLLSPPSKKENKQISKPKAGLSVTDKNKLWWGGHYYSQLFYTDHDQKAFWCRNEEDGAITIKPHNCHCIKIKSTLNISFSDSKPKHDILWNNFHEKSGYLEYNNEHDYDNPIKQVSNIEQCDIELSSSYFIIIFLKEKFINHLYKYNSI